mmetsp:Transcript_22761/g.29472  ORF Transcript_22761/g.29472 Transcript_22761/m.29472 type:complete len:179 (+) Transcript_22761:9-545(+)
MEEERTISSSFPAAVASRDEVRTEFSVNPVGFGIDESPIPTTCATLVSPLLPLPEEEYAALHANVAARQNKVEMKEILNQANRAAGERVKWEARIVKDAQRRAANQNFRDHTVQEPQIATPIDDYQNSSSSSSSKKSSLSTSSQQDQSSSAPAVCGYQVNSYDTSSYQIQDYKSIYEP